MGDQLQQIKALAQAALSNPYLQFKNAKLTEIVHITDTTSQDGGRPDDDSVEITINVDQDDDE